MSTAAQEVKVLEARLATAKEKAEKESRAATLDARLASARQAISEGERRLNTCLQKLREMESAISEADRYSRSAEVSPDKREIARQGYFELQNENEKLNIELGSIKESLATERGVVEKLRSEIAAHPVFIAANKEQREICERAVEVAKRAWLGALENVASLQAQIERLSREEQDAIGRSRAQLEAAGLPKLKPRINSQLGNLIPNIFLTLDLPRLRADCESAAAIVLRED